MAKVKWNCVVLVDAIALQRGYAAPGETCTIPGIGDVSIDWAKHLMGDQIFEILAHNGTDIVTYASSTRHRPRAVELAINIRDRGCIVPGCTDHLRVEYDHRDNYADTHRTDYHSLGQLCPRHHYEKTHLGARLERHDNQWWWYPPPPPGATTTNDGDPNTDSDPNTDGATNGTDDPTVPWRAPIGEHLTTWNLDHAPDNGSDGEAGPATDEGTGSGTDHEAEPVSGDGKRDDPSDSRPADQDDPGPPTLFGDAA